MATKTHIYFGLSHIKGQFNLCFLQYFLIDTFLLVSLERNDRYLTLKSKTSAVVDVFTVTISILLNMLTII